MHETKVTIGFCPRERFSRAPEALGCILKNTTTPYRLVVVDCNTPKNIWADMEPQLQQHNNVKIIHSDQYLLPSACKNIIIENADTEYVCLIENDVLVEPGWLERFLSSSEKHSAGVVVPLIYEIFEDRPERPPRPHFDDHLGRIHPQQTPEGEMYAIEPRKTSRFDDPGGAARSVEFLEAHCLFFRRDLLDRMQHFDGECNASDEIDISMTVQAAGSSAIFDPACTVTFLQPAFPVNAVDRDYFLMRWDPQQAVQSHRRLKQRWKLTHSPQLLGFWHERHARGGYGLGSWRDELKALAGGHPIVLIDGEQFWGSELTEGLVTVPFTENQGGYWGDPADDRAAIEEIEKDRRAGCGLLVFTWNTFWYFTYYQRLSAYLRRHFRCVLDDDRMVAFDLTSNCG